MAAISNKKLLWDDPNFAKRSDALEAVTAVYAKHMLSQSGIDRSSLNTPLTILDNACGNGIVTHEIQTIFQGRKQESFSIICGDLADAMIKAAEERVETSGWVNTRVIKLDAQDTKLPSDHFSHVYTNFGVMLVPRPDDMLDECYRMLKVGGVCAFTTWRQVGWVEDFMSAMNSIPGLPQLQVSASELAKGFNAGDWTDEDYIKHTMAEHNLIDVEVAAIANTSVISSKIDLRRLISVCVGVLSKKYWTPEQQSRYHSPELLVDIEKWMDAKYQGRPVEWQWTALVTTSKKGGSV